MYMPVAICSCARMHPLRNEHTYMVSSPGYLIRKQPAFLQGGGIPCSAAAASVEFV